MEGKKKSWYIRKAVSYKLRSSRSSPDTSAEFRSRSYKDRSETGVCAISGSFRRDDSAGESLNNSVSSASSTSQTSPENEIYRDASMGLFRSQSIEDLIDKYAPLPEPRSKASDEEGRLKYTIAYTGAKYGCSPVMSPTPNQTRWTVSSQGLPESQAITSHVTAKTDPEPNHVMDSSHVTTSHVTDTNHVTKTYVTEIHIKLQGQEPPRCLERVTECTREDESGFLRPADSPSRKSSTGDSALLESDDDQLEEEMRAMVWHDAQPVNNQNSKDSDDSAVSKTPPLALSARVPFEKVQTPSFTQLKHPPSVIISDHSHELTLEESLDVCDPGSPCETESLTLRRHVERKMSNCSDVSDRSDSSRSFMSDSSYSIDDDDLDFCSSNTSSQRSFVSNMLFLCCYFVFQNFLGDEICFLMLHVLFSHKSWCYSISRSFRSQ